MGSIDAVLAIPPTDDAGAQTADRYEWQVAMAAADGLAMYKQYHDGNFHDFDPSQMRVICEYHEDWIIQIGEEVELVSAKHRDVASGHWRSITDIVSRGGVGHLFARWLLLGRRASTRLVTNDPFASGEAKELVACCELLERHEKGAGLGQKHEVMLDNCLTILCKALMMFRKNLPPCWQAAAGTHAKDQIVPADLYDAAREFLSTHRFAYGRPDRNYAHHVAPDFYAKPVLDKIGKSDSSSRSVWEAIMQVFRARMRAKGSTENGGLFPVGPNAQPQTPDREVEARTITLRDIMTIVDTALANPAAYEPIPPLRRVTRLGVKMDRGGCSDTSIERAERLRIDYSRYRRERRNSIPGSDAEFQAIERTLHRIADDETYKVRTDSAPWGDDLWAALSSRMHSSSFEPLGSLELDGDLSLGGICDLTSRCQVWFSERFDIDRAITNAKRQRGGSL
ncbi:hypothetical protein VRY54_01765 [Actinomyces sp. F1_1611]